MTRGRLEAVADQIAAQREAVIGRWLAAARAQPFHRARPEDAVADHIPRLFDALVDLLRHGESRAFDTGDPLQDPAVLAAARAHAAARYGQGLDATAIIGEFRLLRQELGRALREPPADRVGTAELAEAQTVLHDALDGAVLLALEVPTHDGAGRTRTQERVPPRGEELLRLLVERTEEYAIFLLDPEGRVASWNAGAERIKGYAADEIVGRPYATFFTEGDHSTGKPAQLLRRARVEGRVEVEGWRVRKDGSRFWADALLTALYGRQGRLLGYANITRDLTERRRAEEQKRLNTALREAVEARDRALAETEAVRRRVDSERALLETVMRQMPAGVAIAEVPSGRLILSNAQLDYIWRRPFVGSRDMAEYAPYQGFHSDGRPYAPEDWPLARTIATGEVVRGEEIDIVRGDGTPGRIVVGSAPIRDPEGQLIAAVATTVDVTERRRLEVERERLLREVEAERERLRDLFMQAPALVAVLRGPEHVFELVNPPYVRATGRRDAADLLGKPAREALPEIARQGYFDLQDRVYQSGEPFVANEALVQVDRRGDGTLEDVYANIVYHPTRGASGEVDGILVHAVDVTEQVRARQRSELLAAAMADERERFAAVFDQATVGIVQRDLQGRYLLVNDRFCELVGRPREELLRLDDLDLTHPHDRTRYRELLQRLLETGEPYTLEKRYVRPDGSVVWVNNEVSLVRDASGAASYVLAVSQDVTDRREAEEALRKSEERFRTLADNMAQFAWMADPSGDIFWYNQRWFEYTGTTLEEMRDWGWTKVHHPDHVDRVVARIRRSFETGELWEDTFPLRGKDGRYRWFLSRALPIRDESGAIVRWFGTNTDVTELREAQEALRLRSDLIEAAHEAIFAWDVRREITFWNRGAQELYGYTAEEALGRRSHDLLGTPPEQVAALTAGLEREGRWQGELTHATRDGRRLLVEARLVQVRADGRRHILEAARDVTEQRRAEAALRESEARWAFLAGAGRVLGASLDYETTLANVARLAVPRVADGCTVHLLDERGALRQLAAAHVDPDKLRLLRELHERYPDDPRLDTGAAHVVRTRASELVTEIPDGLLERAARDAEHLALLRGLRLLSYMVVRLRVRDEVLGAISFVAGDESGRRFGPEDLALAEALADRAALAIENARHYRQAQEAIRTRDDFLTAASHDLKNPLGSIRGNAQMLLRAVERTGTVPPERLGRSLANVVGSTDQMVRLIDELLDVARLRLGEPLPLERTPTDLVALTRQAVASHQAATERHRIQLRAEEPELAGEWDAARLERVLGNLLSNAIKYSPGGDEVIVTVRRDRDDAVLMVRDEGIGIPAADLSKVFERFERARNVAGRIGGSGIGLAATKQIVEQHGGTIVVESREGEGSTFTVRLPLVAGTSGQEEGNGWHGPHEGTDRASINGDNQDG